MHGRVGSDTARQKFLRGLPTETTTAAMASAQAGSRRPASVRLSPSAPHQQQHDDYEDHDDEDGYTDRNRDSEHVSPPSVAGLIAIQESTAFRHSNRQGALASALPLFPSETPSRPAQARMGERPSRRADRVRRTKLVSELTVRVLGRPDRDVPHRGGERRARPEAAVLVRAASPHFSLTAASALPRWTNV